MQGDLFFGTVTRSFLEPTHPFVHWIPYALLTEVKKPGSVADHSLLFIAVSVELYLQSHIFYCGVMLNLAQFVTECTSCRVINYVFTCFFVNIHHVVK